MGKKIGTNNTSEYVKKHGKHCLLYCLIGCVAVASFIIGWRLNIGDEHDPLGYVLISLGVALGPVAFLGMIYEWFLFDEIRQGAKDAFTSEVASYLEPTIRKMELHTGELIENIDTLSEMHKLGIVKASRDRKMSFDIVLQSMENETTEIFMVGTSLRGILDEDVGDRRFADLFKRKFDQVKRGESNIKIKALLTHPVFAYLRQDLEKLYSRKERFSIAQEIYNAIVDLKELGAKPNNIQFAKATPTCFGIKTTGLMLLNPYPYEDQALGSFCLLVKNEANKDEVYRSFARSHFIWDSKNTEALESFNYHEIKRIFQDQKIEDLITAAGSVIINEKHWD